MPLVGLVVTVNVLENHFVERPGVSRRVTCYTKNNTVVSSTINVPFYGVGAGIGAICSKPIFEFSAHNLQR